MNSKQAARYYDIVEAIAPAIVSQSSLEIAGKIGALRKETIGKAIEAGLKPGHPVYDNAMSEFIRISQLKVADEVQRCGGTVATFAKAILDQTGRMVATHRKRTQATPNV